MRIVMLVSITVGLLAATVLTQSRPVQAPSIEGVWRIAEVVTTGANAATISSPQPSQIMFMSGYYSYVSIGGSKPRPKVQFKDPNKPTDAEKLAKHDEWDALTANAGTYDVKGTTLTRRPTVAKNESVMSNPPIVEELKLGGNTLWITSKSAPGQPASETRRKLIRVK